MTYKFLRQKNQTTSALFPCEDFHHVVSIQARLALALLNHRLLLYQVSGRLLLLNDEDYTLAEMKRQEWSV